jgi:hypothetical protein
LIELLPVNFLRVARKVALAAVFLVWGGTPTVSAQSGDSGFSAAIALDWGFRMNKQDLTRLDDNLRSGAGVGLDFTYDIITNTSIDFLAAYQTFRPEAGKIMEELGPSFQHAGTVLSTKGMRDFLILGIQIRQFITGGDRSAGFSFRLGGGYYLSLQEKLNIQLIQYGRRFEYEIPLESVRSAGLNGGIGLEFVLWKNLSLFSECLYHHIFHSRSSIRFITWHSGIRWTI